MKYIILFFLPVIFIGCTPKSYIEQDDNIAIQDRLLIKEKAKKICKAFENKNSQLIVDLFADQFKKEKPKLDSIIMFINISDIEYSNVVDFKVVNYGNKDITYVSSEIGKHSYGFSFVPYGQETFIHLFSIKNRGSEFEYLVSTVFTEINDEWKLTLLYVGGFMLSKMTSPQLYEKALSYYKYDSDYILPAYYYSTLAVACVKPAGSYLNYLYEVDINSFHTNTIIPLMAEAHFFPKVINSIQSKPEILEMKPVLKNGKVFPKIFYKTNIDFDNLESLKVENSNIHKNINDILPNLYMTSDTFLYEVMDKYYYPTAQHIEFSKLVEKELE